MTRSGIEYVSICAGVSYALDNAGCTMFISDASAVVMEPHLSVALRQGSSDGRELYGMAAMPKGLRHAFGVASSRAYVPPHLVQRWLGHASLRTTAIYADVAGREGRAFASRMWRGW